MSNYNNSKIYKIVDNTNNNIYVGSTKQKYLSLRLASHKNDYKRYLRGEKTFLTSFDIIKNNDYDIILLELVNCNSKDDLHKKERYYIETLDCINKVIPGRTQKEYKKVNKECCQKSCKKYYEKYKDKTLRHQKKMRIYKSSWGGDMRYYNNLLKIDVNLFL